MKGEAYIEAIYFPKVAARNCRRKPAMHHHHAQPKPKDPSGGQRDGIHRSEPDNHAATADTTHSLEGWSYRKPF